MESSCVPLAFCSGSRVNCYAFSFFTQICSLSRHTIKSNRTEGILSALELHLYTASISLFLFVIVASHARGSKSIKYDGFDVKFLSFILKLFKEIFWVSLFLEKGEFPFVLEGCSGFSIFVNLLVQVPSHIQIQSLNLGFSFFW